MPVDDGVNWEGTANAVSGATIEVEAASTPQVGAIRVPIAAGNSPTDLAQNTALEWNLRQPLAGVFAIATGGTGLTRFLHPGGTIQGIAVTFDGKARVELGVGDVGSSQSGDVQLRRVRVNAPNP